MTLATVKDANPELFESMYKRLYEKAKLENESLAYAQLSRMTKAQRKKAMKRGIICIGNWQRLLNDWTANKIENIHVLSYLSREHLEYAGR